MQGHICDIAIYGPIPKDSPIPLNLVVSDAPVISIIEGLVRGYTDHPRISIHDSNAYQQRQDNPKHQTHFFHFLLPHFLITMYNPENMAISMKIKNKGGVKSAENLHVTSYHWQKVPGRKW